MDLDPRRPSLTVAKPLNDAQPPTHRPPGTSGWVARAGAGAAARDEVLETWLDLGLLWGAWVWRAAASDTTTTTTTSLGASSSGGLLWRLPCADAAAGLADLEGMVRQDDAASAAADAAARAAAAAQGPTQTNACVSKETWNKKSSVDARAAWWNAAGAHGPKQ